MVETGSLFEKDRGGVVGYKGSWSPKIRRIVDL